MSCPIDKLTRDTTPLDDSAATVARGAANYAPPNLHPSARSVTEMVSLDGRVTILRFSDVLEHIQPSTTMITWSKFRAVGKNNLTIAARNNFKVAFGALCHCCR